MRVGLCRLVAALLSLLVSIGIALVPTISATAVSVPTSALELDTGVGYFLASTVSKTNNSRALMWSKGTDALPVLKVGWSPDGNSWSTSTLPTLQSELVNRYDSTRVALSISPTSGTLMAMWIGLSAGVTYLRSATTQDGVTWSEVKSLGSYPVSNPDSSVALVSSETTGLFTAVWKNSGPPNQMLSSTTVDDVGSAWSTLVTIPGVYGLINSPQLGIDSSGKMTAVWDVNFNSESFLMASRSTDGKNWENASVISTKTPYYTSSKPSIAVSPAGVVVVATHRYTSSYFTGSPRNGDYTEWKVSQLEVSRYSAGWTSRFITDPGTVYRSDRDPTVSVSSSGYFSVDFIETDNTNSSRSTNSATVKTSADGITWGALSYPFGRAALVAYASDSQTTPISRAISPTGQLFVSARKAGDSYINSLVPTMSWENLTTDLLSQGNYLQVNPTTSQLTMYRMSGSAPNVTISVRTAFTDNAPPVISPSKTRIAAALGASVSVSMTTSNISGTVSYAIDPPLPAGLNFNTATGAISGIASELQASTSYTITGNPSAGSPVTTTVAITVKAEGPSILAVTPSNGQATVSFTSGESGSATISNYKYSTDNGATWNTRSPASDLSPIVLSGLTNGTSYAVKLIAVTSAGDSLPSAAVTVTPATAASAPTITSITPGNASASIAFSSGATGGSPITNYEYSTDGGASWTALSPANTVTPLSISGLSNGTTYSVKIRAVTAVGAGAASSAVSVTPRTVPGAPSLTDALPSSAVVNLTWSAPSSTGGSAITGYTIQQSTSLLGTYANVAAGTCATTAPTSTNLSCTITGLTNGSTYFFRVSAKNATGSGTFSSAFSAIPQTIPGAPVLSLLVASNAQLTATFAAGTNGGGTITAYEYSITGGLMWSPTSPATTTAPTMVITGLANGTAYPVTIRARNAAGPGPASNSITATPITVAVAPTDPAGSPGNDRVTLYWTAPADPAGAAVSGYRIQFSTTRAGSYVDVPSGSCLTAAPTSTNVTCGINGLTNGSSYFFKVAAVNAAGLGAYSSATSAVVPRTTPSAPTLTSLTAGDESIGVNFTSGADGGNAVSSFEYSLDGGLSWSDSGAVGSATSFSITAGLVNGVSYSIQIRAVNDAGPGSGSNTELALPITIADAPTQLVASYGDSSALVAYLSGDNGGSVVTGIEYSLNNGVNWTAVNSLSIANPLALSNLVNGREYQLRIREVTSQGQGRMSAVLPLTVPVPRVEMPGTTLVVGSTSVVDGTGFAPNSDIRIEMHSTPIELGTVRSDPTGSFRTTISIPQSSAAGNHHLVFVYVTSGQAVDSIPFTVALPSALSSTGVNMTQTGSLALAALLATLSGLSLVALRRRTRQTT